MIPRSAFSRNLLRYNSSPLNRHFFSSITSAQNAQSPAPQDPPAQPHRIDPRWLTMMKRRIGRCMMFGMKPAQVDTAGKILQELARDWRELIAGSEGFLTDEKRRSLYRHNVVWGEQDIMGKTYISGHYSDYAAKNSMRLTLYAETARVNWTRNIGIHIDPTNKKEWLNLLNSTGIGLILRSIKINYKFPMKSPDKITVYQKLVHDPSSSLSSQSAFELQVMIISEARQRLAAYCYEDIVTYDYVKNRKTPELPPFMLDQFKTIWKQQLKAEAEWKQRILEIESRVRTLEVESWDRADAVEDTGSAKK
ncbi:hypothetical protein N7488_006643 [Penicillium malachiteum]|nr:hypothetical protein N7488_006643 [Penicillium malachiteum]